MFGWPFKAEDLAGEVVPPFVDIAPTEKYVLAFFQMGWFRYPFEFYTAAELFTKKLLTLPNEYRTPSHPFFWLAYQFGSQKNNTGGHDIFPNNGGAYTEADVIHTQFKSTHYDIGTKYAVQLGKNRRDIALALAMTEFVQEVQCFRAYLCL
jgi:hypothetical protein